MKRWLTALLAALMVIFLCLPALADLSPLPLDDDTAYGQKPLKNGYLSDAEYKDESIHVRIERLTYKGLGCTMVTVNVKDPSQIRTTKSDNTFQGSEMVKGTLLAKRARAVFAVNGDFFKHNVFGYTVRQCYVVRKRLINLASEKYDILFIDDRGDFSFVKKASTETAQAHEDALVKQGRRVVNTFTFGPVLIADGKIQKFDTELWLGTTTAQRVAIAQTGTLEYVVFQCDGNTTDKSGLTMKDFAAMMLKQRPDIKVAYNLDGGGSANLVFNNQKINDNRDVRDICDMIYFASIYTKGD